MLSLSFFAFASLALIVSVTSGELIPRRILAPRVRRESVRHVRSPIGSNPAGSLVRMRGPQEAVDPTAGHFRKGRAVEPVTLTPTPGSLIPKAQSEGFTGTSNVVGTTTGAAGNLGNSAVGGVTTITEQGTTAFPGLANATFSFANAESAEVRKGTAPVFRGRRRRRTSFPRRSQPSQAPSGYRSQPARRPSPSQNPPGQSHPLGKNRSISSPPRVVRSLRH